MLFNQIDSKYPHLKTALLLFVLSLIMRIPFVSSSPNTWDSAYYLTSCRTFFDLGYFPITRLQYGHFLYLSMICSSSWLFTSFTSILSFEKSTILVSVLSGALSVIPMFYIALFLFKKKSTAVISALLFSFCPVIWFFSEEIMSDIPSTLFILTGIALGMKWFSTEKNKYLAAASIVIGLSLLMRVSNYFILPAFILPVFIKTIKKKTLKPMIISSLALAPYLLYVLSAWMILGMSPEFLLHTTDQMSASISNLLSADSWKVFAGIVSTSLTVTLSFLFLFFCIFSYRIMPVKKESENDMSSYGLFLILLWIIPYFLYWRFTGMVNQHSRLLIFITPPIILAVARTVAWMAEEYNRNAENNKHRKTTLLVSVFFISLICLDHIWMRKINTVVLIEDFRAAVSTLSFGNEGIMLILLIPVLAAAFHMLASWVIRKTSGGQKKCDLFAYFVTFVLLLHLTLYSIPLLAIAHNKIQHEKAEAIWFSQHTPENSVILSGHEYPFNRLYAAPRKSIFIGNPDYAVEETRKALLNNRKVFASSNSYIGHYMPFLNAVFDFNVIGRIPAGNLRNQEDHEFRYLNYATFAKAYDVEFYELKLKKRTRK